MVDTFEEFRRFEEMMNRLFDDFWGRPFRRFLPSGKMLSSGERDLALTGYREPYLDILETDKEIIATAEMPGLEKQDIKINLTEDRLEISAETKHEESKEEKDYVYRERRAAGYYRGISLPSPVDPDKSKATYKNGVLELRMPKTHIKEKKSLKVE